MSETAILPGAEAWSVAGGPIGVLVIHGFTGSTQSMRPLAEALVDAGHTVEMPRLPGHGTSVDDMLTTGWDDWSAHVDAVYADLADRCEHVVVTGLSMGGALALWLAARHPGIAGVAVINSAGKPDPNRADELDAVIEQGVTLIDAIGNDIADPDATELAYDQTPLPPLRSLVAAIDELDLAAIRCPTLIFVSDQDHVVPPETADHIAATVAGPTETIHLTRSYHVATLDYDAPLINERIVAFVSEVTRS